MKSNERDWSIVLFWVHRFLVYYWIIFVANAMIFNVLTHFHSFELSQVSYRVEISSHIRVGL